MSKCNGVVFWCHLWQFDPRLWHVPDALWQFDPRLWHVPDALWHVPDTILFMPFYPVSPFATRTLKKTKEKKKSLKVKL